MNLYLLLFYVFIVIVIIQSIYYLLVFSRFAAFKAQKAPKPTQLPISVIICAKNEAEALKTNIPLFTNQQYPKYEIILVNDSSKDSTLDIMNIFSDKYSNVKVVNVEENEAFWGSKKYALTLGIKAAQYEHLLLSDADCKPLSRHWITEMSSCFSNTKSIVLGYGAYEKIGYSFLNKLIRFETLLTAIQYFSYSLIGMPYMGVGRNLAYKKEAFFIANGFASHMNIPSGDDDLFINEIATPDNVAINISPFSFTKSQPENTFKLWIQQKRRHIATSFNYKLKHKIILGVFYVSQLLFWLLAISLIISQFKLKTVLILFLVTIGIKYIILGLAAKNLKEKDIIFWIPFLELSLICFQLFIFISNLFSKQHRWK